MATARENGMETERTAQARMHRPSGSCGCEGPLHTAAIPERPSITPSYSKPPGRGAWTPSLKRPAYGIQSKKRKRACSAKRISCCEQLFEILKTVPGVDLSLFHKPKVPVSAKVDCLCGMLPTKDGIVPLMLMLFRRAMANKPAGNDFEKKIFKALKALPPNQRRALESTLKAYDALSNEKRDCLFRKKFVDWKLDDPIDAKTVAHEWISEGLIFAGDIFYPMSGGEMGQGSLRPWEREGVFEGEGPKEFNYVTRTAPWPWICKVQVGNSNRWLRNNDHRPANFEIEDWELDKVCTPTYTQSQPDDVVVECVSKLPSAEPDSIFPMCEGGSSYTRPTSCFKIADAIPGDAVSLSGFNFFGPCKIELRKHEDPSIVYDPIEVPVWPDTMTPVEGADGKVIADCRVQDCITFNIPKLHPNQENVFDPGLYEVRVRVQNDEGYTIPEDGSQPTNFLSNPVLLKVAPDPDLKYQIFNDFGHCYTETSGPGGDEIWWHVGTANLGGVALETGNFSLAWKDMPHDPWGDMDTGEDTQSSYSFDFFNGKPEALAIVLVAFEVDSEDAMKEQLTDWDDAFGSYMGSLWAALVASGALLSEILDQLGAEVGWVLLAAAVVIVVGMIVGIFWAMWAPADLVALDLITRTPGELFELTNPKVHLGPETYNPIQDVLVTVTPVTKAVPDPNAAFATYVETRRYERAEEDTYPAAVATVSDYSLTVRTRRVTV